MDVSMARDGQKRYRHKFHAKPTKLDGIRFDSKKEAAYYGQLKIRQQAGDIVFFLRQIPFYLPGGVRYVVDFLTFDVDGTVHFIDVKGHRTPQYIMKKKMVEAIYPIEIEEV